MKENAITILTPFIVIPLLIVSGYTEWQSIIVGVALTILVCYQTQEDLT